MVSRPTTHCGIVGGDIGGGQEDRSYFGVAPMRLSTAKIQNSPPQKKPLRLFDGRGLYLEIAPTGSRWWHFKYRFAGKEKAEALVAEQARGVRLRNARLEFDGRPLGEYRLSSFRSICTSASATIARIRRSGWFVGLRLSGETKLNIPSCFESAPRIR
jgi:hypothetical protein